MRMTRSTKTKSKGTPCYARLPDGTWGVRVEGPAPRPGAFVRVTKRDGSSKLEVIQRVVWTEGETHLCSIREE